MIRMMCGVRLVDRVSTDGLRDRMGVVVKIEDMIFQNHLRWYGHVIRWDINSHIREVRDLDSLQDMTSFMDNSNDFYHFDRVPVDGFHERVGVIVKIEDLIIQNRLRWYGHVIRRQINSQIHQFMELEIIGKRKKGRPKKSWEECIKKDLERCLWSRKMARTN